MQSNESILTLNHSQIDSIDMTTFECSDCQLTSKRKSHKARIQNSVVENKMILPQKGRQPFKEGRQLCPNRKTNLPKEEDDITQNRRQPCPLLIGQTLLVCSLCDIFVSKTGQI